jgi:hypothetical protein
MAPSGAVGGEQARGKAAGRQLFREPVEIGGQRLAHALPRAAVAVAEMGALLVGPQGMCEV